jgi:transcriptional regulator with XRE-family HTH domain
MARSRSSPRYERLLALLTQLRTNAGLTQADVAKHLRRPQSFVSKYENGERRLDLIELIEIADLLNFDLMDVVQELKLLPAL